MISAAEAVIWINRDTREVLVCPHGWVPSRFHWSDPIGAAYRQWVESSNDERVRVMLETAIDLAMQGFPIADVVRAFAEVEEFKALGRESFPMCRALTSALVGQCLEPNTMDFDELLIAYEP